MPSAIIFHPFLIKLYECSIIVICDYNVNLSRSHRDLPYELLILYQRVLHPTIIVLHKLKPFIMKVGIGVNV